MIKGLHYILTIANAERIMLYRTAKFWVLAGIGVLFIIFFMVVMTIVTIVENRIPAEFMLEGTDGLLALYFFSYVQAILTIFVAGDFRKAEEKARLLLKCYPSQLSHDWFDEGAFLGLARLRGVQARAQYAEAFLVEKATINFQSAVKI